MDIQLFNIYKHYGLSGQIQLADLASSESSLNVRKRVTIIIIILALNGTVRPLASRLLALS
jgi:hypothetical protein